MGKLIKNGINYSASSDSATNIKYDDTKNVKEAIDELSDTLSNLITITIASGETSATITNSKITTTSIVDVYFKDKVLAPTSLVVTDGQIVLEIDAEDTDTEIGIRII